eukprot:10980264-Alexandrium_andersonii.AAC.1
MSTCSTHSPGLGPGTLDTLRSPTGPRRPPPLGLVSPSRPGAFQSGPPHAASLSGPPFWAMC